ncbi:MAG: hypothetical protein CK425_02210 [Parachlamydia sp.]|nr:MAG: hypothetical protein CK425_02210 [Parachlamydia sp.]
MNNLDATPPSTLPAFISSNEPPRLPIKRKAKRQISPASMERMQAAFRKLDNTSINGDINEGSLFLRRSAARLHRQVLNSGITPVPPNLLDAAVVDVRNHSNKRQKLNEGNK